MRDVMRVHVGERRDEVRSGVGAAETGRGQTHAIALLLSASVPASIVLTSTRWSRLGSRST